MKRILLGLLIAFLLATTLACRKQESKEAAPTSAHKKLTVVTTIFPL
jgi:ABC-type Zn uptake system ZnuABC Zn-binding protein ZnuA